MPLASGTRLGAYEVVGLLGAGGMGEVYRARDTKLRRDVALKILPPAFAADPDRRARFTREAHVLASLNHPHIASIYGIEELEGVTALVLELVEGPTLDDRLKAGGGRQRLEEALTIAVQIAHALEAAHEKGLVHRDLKSANIKLTAAGSVKVLDFGLAKALDPDGATPTATLGTSVGAVVGTLAYMSPEQAAGRAVDKRTDVWAFGCILFEMLTGTRDFGNWTKLPAATPDGVRRVLRRCLEKDPERRLRDIADARLEIEDARHLRTDEAAAPASAPLPPVRSTWTLVALSTAVVLVAVSAILVVFRQRPPATASEVRFTVAPPSGDTLVSSSVAMSPDGTRLAYVVSHSGTNVLMLRRFTETDATIVSGSDGADGPFFSPDGRSIAFFAGGKLKTVPLTGGTPSIVCDAPSPRGGAWAPDGTIIFAPRPRGVLARVPATGGTPVDFTRLAEREQSHRFPHVLADGSAIVFGAGPAATQTFWNEAHIVAQSLATGERQVVVARGTYPRHLESGHVVYLEANTLHVVAFDARRLVATGAAVALSDRVVQGGSGVGLYDVSRTGSIVFWRSAGPTANSLVWADRSGKTESIDVPVAMQSQPRLSPDGTRIAYTVAEPDTDIWVYDVARGTRTRLTAGGGNLWPIWTPDGGRIAFTSTRTGTGASFWKPADGSGSEEPLTDTGMPFSFSPDGKTLAYVRVGSTTGYDIWFLPLATRKPAVFAQTPFVEHQPAFSPDGRWVAYVSNDSGRNEVYVRAYPGPSQRWQVSVDGGSEPMWNRNNRELFFRRDDAFMAVEVRAEAGVFRPGAPRVLFRGRFTPGLDRPNYDVTRDGQRFVIVKPAVASEPPPPDELTVVLNWAGARREVRQ